MVAYLPPTVWQAFFKHPLSIVCLFCSVAEHLIAQHSAIKMLHSRVKVILEYVKAVEAGERTAYSDEGWKGGMKDRNNACSSESGKKMLLLT